MHPHISTSILELDQYYYMSVEEWTEERPERSLSRCRSARAPRTPRQLSPRRKSIVPPDEDRVMRNNERNKRPPTARPASARDPPRSCSRRGSILSQRPAFTVY